MSAELGMSLLAQPEVPGPGGGRGRVDEAVIPGHDTAAGAADTPRRAYALRSLTPVREARIMCDIRNSHSPLQIVDLLLQSTD